MKTKSKLKTGLYIDWNLVEKGWDVLTKPRFEYPTDNAVC